MQHRVCFMLPLPALLDCNVRLCCDVLTPPEPGTLPLTCTSIWTPHPCHLSTPSLAFCAMVWPPLWTPLLHPSCLAVARPSHSPSINVHKSREPSNLGGAHRSAGPASPLPKRRHRDSLSVSSHAGTASSSSRCFGASVMLPCHAGPSWRTSRHCHQSPLSSQPFAPGEPPSSTALAARCELMPLT
jgi:hypothetical protein